MDKSTKKIIASVAIAAAAAGAGAVLDMQPTDPNIQLLNPEVISWDKPVNDAEWAEDVKAENLDIKSTETLQVMLESHTKKLERLQDTFQREYVDCVECTKYDIKTYLENNGETNDAQAVDNVFTNEKNSDTAEIAKLTRSIERMENELRLRSEGFVVPDKNHAGTPTAKKTLDKVDSSMVRKIND